MVIYTYQKNMECLWLVKSKYYNVWWKLKLKRLKFFIKGNISDNGKDGMMSKAEILHELYHQCSEINFNDSHEIISSAESEEEADFFRIVTDFVLQQKQKKVIEEKRF